jgi:hypothetical protein
MDRSPLITALKSKQGGPKMQVTTVGIDLAKNVFRVHGCDANGKAVVRKQLSGGGSC